MAFYRSSIFRLIQILTGLTLAVVLVWPGEQEWRQTRSLKLVHVDNQTVAAIGAVVFLCYAFLLIANRKWMAELADWIGLFVGMFLVCALFATLRWHEPFNWAIALLALQGVASHYAAARLAHFDRHGL